MSNKTNFILGEDYFFIIISNLYVEELRNLNRDELWDNGEIVETSFDNLLALSDATVI